MLSRRYAEDGVLEAGVDEAGRGSFWGSLYAAAVIWPNEATWTDEIKALIPNIKDSKKLSAKKRDKIADDIKRLATDWAVGNVTAAEIDTNGIQWANKQAFHRALDGLKRARPGRALIDGILPIVRDDMQIVTVVDGDAQFIPIAAASIIAKVDHDCWLKSRCDADLSLITKYDLLSCKGYGTARHRLGIQTHGLHSEHRRTFIRTSLHPEGLSNKTDRARLITGDEENCLINLANTIVQKGK
jgi:ribonuclease HII